MIRTLKLLRRVPSSKKTRSSCSSGPAGSGRTWVRPSGFDTGLKTFNSLTKRTEPLVLTREGVATWYRTAAQTPPPQGLLL